MIFYNLGHLNLIWATLSCRSLARMSYNILRTRVVYVFEYYHMNINYLSPIFGSPLPAIGRSRRLIKKIKDIHFVAYLWIIFNGVRCTKNLCAARACSSYQTALITRMGAPKIPCNDAENSMSWRRVTGRSRHVERQPCWNFDQKS